jgi:hypothetical protein
MQDTTALAKLTGDILAINDTMTADQVLEVREKLLFAKAKIRELEKDMNDGLIEWMRVNGDLQISEDKRLYIGKDKRIKCNNTAATLEALLTKTGGDFDAVCDCLSSNAFKHGACRTPLGDDWDTHFDVEEIDEVKVKEADAKFARKLKKG